LLISRNRYTRFEANLPDFGGLPIHRVDFRRVNNLFPYVTSFMPVLSLPSCKTMPPPPFYNNRKKGHTKFAKELEIESTLTMSLLAFLITSYCVQHPRSGVISFF